MAVGGRDSPLGSLAPQVKPFLAVNAVNPLMIDQPALAPQEHVNALVAVTDPHLGNFTDALPEDGIIDLNRFVVIASTAEFQHCTRPPNSPPR